MATKKRTIKKATRTRPSVKKVTTTRPQVTSSNGPSYDTMMIITILLLLFMYPLGLIFMWAWMRTWPVWLKIVISLPLIISLLFIFLIFIVLGKAISQHRYERMNYKYNMQNQQPKTMYISPSPASNQSF